MSGIRKISALPSATKLTNDSVIAANQSGVTYQVTNLLTEERGDIIVNNSKLASIPGQANPHDVHLLVNQPGDSPVLLFLYRIHQNYYIVGRDINTFEILYQSNIVGVNNTGWSPRMIPYADDTVRIIYTKSSTTVYFKDLTVSTGALGAESNFMVQIKDGVGGYEVEEQLTITCFIQHVANVSGIDYSDGAFDTFATRSILVTDTQQMQFIGGVYYLTVELLADSMPGGDTGGIACVMKSTDLGTWQLNDPIRITATLDDQRDHEVSVTYLNGGWHAFSRFNNQNFDESGYNYYTSPDADTWTAQGLADLPNAMKGIRHSIFKHTLKYLAPSGEDLNATTKNVAFMLYQRIPTVNTVTDGLGTHSGRTEMGLVYTEDFVTFTEVAHIIDRNMVHYPSMYIYQDILHLAWSSGYMSVSLLGSIKYSSYNLNNL